MAKARQTRTVKVTKITFYQPEPNKKESDSNKFKPVKKQGKKDAK